MAEEAVGEVAEAAVAGAEAVVAAWIDMWRAHCYVPQNAALLAASAQQPPRRPLLVPHHLALQMQALEVKQYPLLVAKASSDQAACCQLLLEEPTVCCPGLTAEVPWYAQAVHH